MASESWWEHSPDVSWTRDVRTVLSEVSIMLAITCSYPLQLYVLVSVLVPSLVQPRAPPQHWVRSECAPLSLVQIYPDSLLSLVDTGHLNILKPSSMP